MGLIYAQKVFDEHWSTYGTDTNKPEEESLQTTTAKRARAEAKARTKAVSTATKPPIASMNENQIPPPTINRAPFFSPMMMPPTVQMQMNPFPFPLSMNPPANMIPPHLNHNRIIGPAGLGAMGSTPMQRAQGQLESVTAEFSPMLRAQRNPQPGLAVITGPSPMLREHGNSLQMNDPALGLNPMVWAQEHLHTVPVMGQHSMIGGQLQPPILSPQVSLYVKKLQSDVVRLGTELKMARSANRNNKYRVENPNRSSYENETVDTQKPQGKSSNPNNLNNSDIENSRSSSIEIKQDNIFSLKYQIEELQQRCKLERNMRLEEIEKAKTAQAKHKTLVKDLRNEIDALKRDRILQTSSTSPSMKSPRTATMRIINYSEQVSDDEEMLGDNSPRKRRKKKTTQQEPKPRGKPGPKPKPIPPTVFEQAEKKHKQAMKWVENFNVLKAYKETHGHCDMPKSHNARVKQWITDNRTQHRLMLQGKPHSLTPDKIRTLNSIDFVWRVGANFFTWEQNFDRLKAYAQEHGHCRVSQKKPGKGYEGLGDWVLVVRRLYLKKGKRLTEDRMKQLEEIGFEWSLRNRGGTLEERMATSADECANTENSGDDDDYDDDHDDGSCDGNERINAEDQDGKDLTTDTALDSSPIRTTPADATSTNVVSPTVTNL